jgi:hypothetical protein
VRTSDNTYSQNISTGCRFAESALETECEEHKAGPWEHTPWYLDDLDDLHGPDLGSGDDWLGSGEARALANDSISSRSSQSS